jgi:hypothetical protein
MLLLNATLRDILSVRMGMFSSSSILSILSDTLIHYLLQWGEGIRRSHLIERHMSNGHETYAGVSTVRGRCEA